MKTVRLFVEKKKEFQTEANALLEDLNSNLNQKITELRLVNIYDIFDVEDDVLEKTKYQVFGEIVTDNVYERIDLKPGQYFAVEYLPGQFDQRADSANQCIRLIEPTSKSRVKSGKLIILEGVYDLEKIKKYMINSIESREKDLQYYDHIEIVEPNWFNIVREFRMNDVSVTHKNLNLAMSLEDLEMIKNYFIGENRDPYEVEIRALDTYWSDHCRHTTFNTHLDITILDKEVLKTYNKYLKMREEINASHKPTSLMDMATINARYERKKGNLDNLEVSDENNACSVFVDVDVDGINEKWLMMFKNETHNHPTEIEPLGGASTCVGGAIRDPLSGRAYVYQALRVTGAANILDDIDNTIVGKLPQRVISKVAAQGNSSYGNQIGVPTTLMKEIFHENYVAKRMELGAIVGAVPYANIIRDKPTVGDVVILLGGRTGRDGIGGATGSSKEQDKQSLEVSSSEVQKGNAPEERKIQRFFRNKDISKIIKKANDFGAGGVTVAIGELADSIEIWLDKVPLKYQGLNEIEIAISESQERMACVVAKENAAYFIMKAEQENLEATIVAEITNTNRLVMKYHDKKVVDIARDFISTNGAVVKASAMVNKQENLPIIKLEDSKDNYLSRLSNYNIALQRGIIEMFDCTIGAATILMPLGGIYQMTESQVSVVKLPVLNGETNTCSAMTFGYDPYLTSINPYLGSQYAIIDSIAKLVAVGVDYKKIYFSFQEYFEKINKDSEKFGKVVSSLLGSVKVLSAFRLASVGGKDSMSGTYQEISVPPTLVSFGISTLNANDVISNDLKKSDSYLYLFKHNSLSNNNINTSLLKKNFSLINKLILEKKVVSAYALGFGGLLEAICKMAVGNRIGVNINYPNVFEKSYGSILIESVEKIDNMNALFIGKTTSEDITINKIKLKMSEVIKALDDKFKSVFPTNVNSNVPVMEDETVANYENVKSKFSKKTVKVLIPVFPGTNCDYDTAKAFIKAGASVEYFVFRNKKEHDVEYSINELAQKIDECDILVISGGFSASDEPDGSGKFVANVLRNEKIFTKINKMLENKCLILGICNGFQALLKAGLLPEIIKKVGEDQPTLVRNDINRHVSKFTNVVVSSNMSPWLSSFKVGEIFKVPVSHGEGKFVISERQAKKLFRNGQVAFQYADLNGNVSNDSEYNINGSHYAIEGIVSQDGLILGKMAHSERSNNSLFKNIYGNKEQDIFKNAVKYFKGDDQYGKR